METITAEEVRVKIENGEKLQLVDVREDDEVANGMIPGAIHIRMGDIPSVLEQFDKDQEYIFICHSGGRSANVCYYLEEKGYNVRNMVGGMMTWNGEIVF